MIAVAVALLLSAAVFAEESDKEELSLSLLFQGFIAVGCGTEKNLGDGQGSVRDGGVYDAGLHWDAVDGREGEADDEVECTDASGYGYCKSESADQGQEEGINYVEVTQERSSPDCACGHEPVGEPDQGCITEEHPFSVHAKAT